jgi:hypothetical protein
MASGKVLGPVSQRYVVYGHVSRRGRGRLGIGIPAIARDQDRVRRVNGPGGRDE